jgi:hypothetical protein
MARRVQPAAPFQDSNPVGAALIPQGGMGNQALERAGSGW